MISETPTPYLLIRCYSSDEREFGGYAFIHLIREILEDLPLLRNNVEILKANFPDVSTISIWDDFLVLTPEIVSEIERIIGDELNEYYYYLTEYLETIQTVDTENHKLEVYDESIRWVCCHDSNEHTYHTHSVEWEIIEAIQLI